jgi:hypothetical protein
MRVKTGLCGSKIARDEGAADKAACETRLYLAANTPPQRAHLQPHLQKFSLSRIPILVARQRYDDARIFCTSTNKVL